MSTLRAAALTLGGVAVLTACGLEVDASTTPPEGSVTVETELGPAVQAPDSVVREILPEDWPGYELGLPLPVAFDLGPEPEFDGSPMPTMPTVSVSDHADDAELIEDDAANARMIVYHRGHRFLVELSLSHEVSRIVDERVEAKLRPFADLNEDHADIAESSSEDVGGAASALIVGGVDDRELLPLSKWGIGSWVAPIGMLTELATEHEQCTGTLVGERTILTAAHCVIAANNSKRDLMFRPRHEGNMNPLGEWTNMVNANVFVPTDFTSNNCGAALSLACVSHDWALIKLTRPATPPAVAQFHLFFRYAALSQADLVQMKNRGYPNCGASDAPSPCVPQALYGNKGPGCGLGPDNPADVDLKSYRRLTHTCDASQGQSGSPLYRYIGNYPKILGVISAECPSSQDCNLMRHVTPGMKTTIDNFAI